MTTELQPYHAPAAELARPQVPGLVDAWLAGRKPSTVAGYRKDVADFTRYLRRADRGQTIDAFFDVEGGTANAIVLGYRNDQLERGLASATIARRLASLKSLVKLARMLGRVVWSIEVEPPRPEKRRDMSGPDESSVRKLNRAAGKGDAVIDRRDRAMFGLMIGMGLRRGEVATLALADVDWPCSKLRVLRKGRREQIELAMPPEVFSLLSNWASVRGPEPGPLFFRTDRGSARVSPPRALSGESIRQAVARLARRAKLPPEIRPHGLRHSFVTHLLSLGETIPDVMAAAGHSKPETTLAYLDRKNDAATNMYTKAARVLKP